MIEVKHTCGHIQSIFMDEKLIGPRADAALARLGKTKQEFIDGQVAWLSSYPCPSCYSNWKDKYK